ncbi:MAG: type 4a pilus biogenesis protein PilO [Candidatus Omnitrophota bacterium]|nr:type 4a pilus biogenesis protein PilO [Candidatus Omnitrophota bacterium]
MIKVIQKIQLDKKKIIAGAIILLIILYIDFTFILKSQFNLWKAINPKIAQLKKDIKKLNDDLAILSTSIKGKQETQETTQRTAEKIIKEEKIPNLLEEISKIANKRDVKIMQIKPLSSPPTAKPELTTAATKLFPVSIKLDLLGGYHQLGKFINDLENASVFMEVENLRISSQTSSIITQQIELTLKTYVKK